MGNLGEKYKSYKRLSQEKKELIEKSKMTNLKGKLNHTEFII